MRRMIWVMATVTFLSGCQTFGQLERGLDALMGHSAQEAFGIIGYLTAKQQFGSDIVYVWSTSSSGALVFPSTSHSNGTVGGVGYNGTTTYNQVVPVNYSCLIKLIADENDRLKRWEYEGNIGGCSAYTSRLAPLTKSAG